MSSFELVSPLELPRGLFWGANRRRGPACRGWGGRGNTLRGCHFPLPVGQQEMPLPHRSSADHHAARRPVLGVVFWYRSRGHSSTRWFVPPCLTCAQWPKTHLSSLRQLHPGGAGQTHVELHPLLSSFRCRSHATRTWCTPELVKAIEKGHTLVKIHEVRLRQHVVKSKTGIGGVAQLGSDGRSETELHSSLPGAGGDPTG